MYGCAKFRTSTHMRVCEKSHIHTHTGICETITFKNALRTCKSANVQNFAHSHTCKMCAIFVKPQKYVQLFVKKMCSAKMHKWGCAKFCTLAHVQNVYDVCAGAENSPHKLEMLRLTDLGTKKVQNLKLQFTPSNSPISAHCVPPCATPGGSKNFPQHPKI